MPTLPRFWLFTDERQGAGLWTALDRLPRGAGIVFRHRSLPPAERRALFDRVRRVARARGLVLVLAGPARQAAAWAADGAHGREATKRAGLLLTRPAHGARELAAAASARADLAFVSPVLPTRSHPGAATLGGIGFGRLLRITRVPVAALGGMDARRFARLPRGAHGWAAIDGWSATPARGAATGVTKEVRL